MPATAKGAPLRSKPVSTSTPQILREPIWMSFGHLIAVRSPVAASIAAASATAHQVVSRGHMGSGSSGRSSSENHSPRCEADSQRRPKRPRPADCRSAKIATPPATPCAPSCAARSFVESVSSYTTISRTSAHGPRRAVRSSAMIRSGAERSRWPRPGRCSMSNPAARSSARPCSTWPSDAPSWPARSAPGRCTEEARRARRSCTSRVLTAAPVRSRSPGRNA